MVRYCYSGVGAPIFIMKDWELFRHKQPEYYEVVTALTNGFYRLQVYKVYSDSLDKIVYCDFDSNKVYLEGELLKWQPLEGWDKLRVGKKRKI